MSCSTAGLQWNKDLNELYNRPKFQKWRLRSGPLYGPSKCEDDDDDYKLNVLKVSLNMWTGVIEKSDKMGALSPGFLVWDTNENEKIMKANKAKANKAVNGGKASMSLDRGSKERGSKISSASADAVLGRYSVLLMRFMRLIWDFQDSIQ